MSDARPYTVRAVQSKRDLHWRTQINAGNGLIVATGHQRYAKKGSAERAALNLAGASLAFVKLPRENAK